MHRKWLAIKATLISCSHSEIRCIMQILILVFMLVASAASQQVFCYVKPDYSLSSCPDQPCRTLDEYASETTRYFTTNATFLFLPGNHSISTHILLKNTSNVSLRLLNDSVVTIIFKNAGSIELREVVNFEIQGMTIILHPTLNIYQPAILSILYCRGVAMFKTKFLPKYNLSNRQKGGIFCKHSSIIIKNCLFEGFKGENATINAKSSNVSLYKSAFYRNRGYVGGACAFSACIVTLDGNVFHKNMANGQGGAIYLDRKSSLVFKKVVGNVFTYNSAGRSGGAICCSTCRVTMQNAIDCDHNQEVGFEASTSREKFCNDFSVEQAHHAAQTLTPYHRTTYFANNWAGAFGGAIQFVGLMESSLSGIVILHNNSALSGGGMSANSGSSISFSNCMVLTKNRASLRGGAIYMEVKSIISFSGYALLEKNQADENGGAIFATISTAITVRDNVSLTGNQATQDGGAMYFASGASLTLANNTIILLSENYAKRYGGAIFHEDAITPDQCTFSSDDYTTSIPVCFINLESYSFPSVRYRILAVNNTADKDGSFLFGGLLDRCVVMKYEGLIIATMVPLFPILMKNFIHVLNDNKTETQPIMSQPYRLCFCNTHGRFWHYCIRQTAIETQRGAAFTVPLTAYAQGNVVTSSPIRAKMSPSARLLPEQRTQFLHRNCTDIALNMFSTVAKEMLILYLDGSPCSDTGTAWALVQVTFLPCPDAFTLSGDQCVCEERLQAFNASCSILSNSEYYITRKTESSFWVSASKSNGSYEGLISCPVCPMEYCRTDSVNITLSDPDIQCDYNRSGVLCGACRANYSLTFGSSTCELCSNAHLALLLPFAAAGIALVVFLTVFRLTVATGAINSIILYANVVQANRNIISFASSTNNNILTIFIAWMNLDLGFRTCFYNGMDAYAQTWLQFAFPIYVWLLMCIIILTSRYSMKVTKLIGSNPVAILATLLLMSYTKLLKIVIEVYSSANLELPYNKTETVWLKDANVPYLQTWHLAQTVVITIFLAFLFLPYTLLLLLGYKLYRFTGKKHTYWLIRIKPLLDSYYAPYKMNTRYWTGFLLLVRCALYIVFSNNSLGQTTHSLLAIMIVFAILIVWLSVNIYSKVVVNTLEAVVYLNMILLSAATLAEASSPALVDCLVGMVLVMMIGIVLYHFHTYCFAKSTLWMKIHSKMATFRAKPTEATPLLAPVASAAPQQKAATSPSREPTGSVVFLH